MTNKASDTTDKISLPSNLFDRLTSGRTLILLASLANTSLWVMTGVLAEGNTPIAWFSAICLGLSVSLGLVKIAEKWAAMPDEVERRVPLSKPAVKEMVDNDRKKIAAISFSAVLSVEALMLAPVIIALEGGYRISQVLPPVFLWAWAIGRPLVAVLVMAGLAVVADEHKPKQPTTTTLQPETTKKQPPAKQEEPTRRELSDVALTEEIKRIMSATGKEPTQAQLGIIFGVSAAAIGKRIRKMKGK